ncbi:MAG: hypothetical protein H6560_03990 [Lewinellaceae bacterium]|nr:hypothetical protein [Lewinellaceae bacterium]
MAFNENNQLRKEKSPFFASILAPPLSGFSAREKEERCFFLHFPLGLGQNEGKNFKCDCPEGQALNGVKGGGQAAPIVAVTFQRLPAVPAAGRFSKPGRVLPVVTKRALSSISDKRCRVIAKQGRLGNPAG